jgi:hypothetical protein
MFTYLEIADKTPQQQFEGNQKNWNKHHKNEF